MATTDLIPTTRPHEGEVFVPRKKFKTSDLPLNSIQRSTIDSLLHTIKKKGEYDALRKKVWSQYAESVSVEYLKPHHFLFKLPNWPTNISFYSGRQKYIYLLVERARRG
jgi:hypothetical protein